MDNQPPKSPFPFIPILVSIIAFGLGAILVMLLLPIGKSTSTNPSVTVSDTGKVVLPTTAIRIQACSDRQGALYVEPQNIPAGPIYMVNKGDVIGVEYMLAKDEFLSGKSYDNLLALGIKVDHVRIGFLSNGHEGYPVPHYHVFLYTVTADVEQNIICPKVATPSGTLIPIPSVSPSPSMAM